MSFVPYPISEFFGFHSSIFCFFRSSYFGWRFFCCALVPGTLALDLPTLILERGLVFFSVSLSVTTEFVSLYDEGSGRTLGVLLMMSLGRKNERFNVKFFFLHIKPFVLSTQHQQYPQCPSWFFIVERYKFCGHSETKKNFTLNRSFFLPNIISMSFLILHRREIQILWSDSETEKNLTSPKN